MCGRYIMHEVRMWCVCSWRVDLVILVVSTSLWLEESVKVSLVVVNEIVESSSL